MAIFARSGGITSGPDVRTTYGEFFSDGTIVDLAAVDDHLELLVANGQQKPYITPQFLYASTIYQAPAVDPNILGAITFPRAVADYGSDDQLFENVAKHFQDFLGLSYAVAAYVTTWISGSHVPELMTALPTLCVVGAPMRQGVEFFRLLACFCRRPLITAELSRSLPTDFRTTLLVTDPTLNDRTWGRWNAGGYPGVFVTGRGGKIAQLACSKAVLLQPRSFVRAWGEDIMSLPFQGVQPGHLNDAYLAKIRAKYQPQYAAFRLKWLRERSQEFVAKAQSFSKFGLSGSLLALAPEQPKIMQALLPQFESQNRELLEQRSTDPDRLSVETVWFPSHQIDGISTAQIAEGVTSAVKSRGGNGTYNSRQIGRRLNQLGLRTRGNGKCKELKFTGAVRQRIHQLVREMQLDVTLVAGCSLCESRN